APDSPYAHHLRRLLLMYQRQLTNPTPPERVAETIEEAVTTPTPRLRWLVGDDAQRLVAGRRRISDEEFVADASAATDAEGEAGQDDRSSGVRREGSEGGQAVNPISGSRSGGATGTENGSRGSRQTSSPRAHTTNS